jgi:hypothetical protein
MLKILNTKLLRMAKVLKSWSKGLFSDAKVQFHMAQELGMRLDVAQQVNALIVAEAVRHKNQKLRLLGLAVIERARKRQCSRIN